jgi:hypothetical protein
MASTLFDEEAYRAAFNFNLGCALSGFAVELFGEVFFVETDYTFDFFAVECVGAAWDAAF